MRTLVLLLLLSVPAWAMENALPSAAPEGRYDQSLAQSPFALATKVEAPAAPEESFAANWVLTGLSRLPDDQGAMQDFVTIRSRDQRMAFTLFGSQESTDDSARGVAISKVERSPDPRKSFVTLKRGTETAKVEFGQEVASPQAGMPQPGVPNAAPRPGFPPVGGNVPAMNNQIRPGTNLVRPTLPRPVAGPPVAGGGPGASGGPGGPSAALNPAADHRRVRVIQSKP